MHKSKIQTVKPGFGARLHKLMTENVMTQTKLASYVKPSPRMIRFWLNDIIQPSEESLEIIADLFMVSVEWLKGEDVSKDKDIKRNASGYYDPTAYAALKNIEKTKKERNKIMERKFNNGEIWEAATVKGKKLVAIVKTYDNYCVCLQLFDNHRYAIEEAINAQGIKYYNPSMIGYEYNNKIEIFIRKMTDEEYKKMLDSISRTLGFGSMLVSDTSAEEIKLLKEKVATEHDENLKLKSRIYILENAKTIMPESAADAEDEKKKLVAERDIYKSLYNKLLERMIG